MVIDDINGTRPRSIYRGVAKDIISAKDIEGTSPKFEKVSTHDYLYNMSNTSCTLYITEIINFFYLYSSNFIS